MSSATALIEKLESQGVSFQLDDDHLIVKAPAGVIDLATSKRLRRQKRQVMAVLSDAAAQEKRRKQVLQMMDGDTQRKKHYWLTDTDADPRFVILAMAIRDVGTCELKIPRAKYDPFLLAKALEQTNEARTREH